MEEKSKGRMVSDPEIKAMAAAVRLLDGLDPSARSRVVDYLCQRYCNEEYRLAAPLQPYDGGCPCDEGH